MSDAEDGKPEHDATGALLRHLDGRLSAAEAAALAERLRSDAGERKAAARLLLQIGGLQELASESRRERARLPASPAPAAPRPRRLSRWLAAGTVGMAVAAGVLIVATRDRRAPAPRPGIASRASHERHSPPAAPPSAVPALAAAEVARVVRLEGVVRELADGTERPLAAGGLLPSGRGVATVGPQARATLALTDGTRLELGGDTLVLALEGRQRIAVERGTLVATVVSAAGGPATIVAPLASLTTGQARLRLAVSAQETRVEVEAGAVEVVRLSDRERLTVAARQQAVITDSGALAAVAIRPSALLVKGGEAAHAAELDRLMAARLEGLGFAVEEIGEDRLARDDLGGKDLVVISSSTSAQLVREHLLAVGLRESSLPVVTCENTTFDLLGMTGPVTSRQHGSAAAKTTVEIEVPGQPLAAGLEGHPRIAMAPVSVAWGEPGDGAIKVATMEGSRHRRAVQFAYERGALMVGMTAPGRRVGCFLDAGGIGTLTEAGWQLFDAGVRWAVR
jgi:ferric-dicitrate binding protein FerR (iron transport regulator)